MFMKYLSNCFKRALLYQVLIAFAVLRLMEAWRFHRDFMAKIKGLLESVHIDGKVMNYLPRDSEMLYKGFLIGLIVLAALSILGIGLFEFIAGLGCLLVAFLYYNPIPEFQKKIAHDPQGILPSMEFLLFAALGLAMITNAFSFGCCQECYEKSLKKDVEIEMTDQSSRDKTPSSSEDKKKKTKKRL